MKIIELKNTLLERTISLDGHIELQKIINAKLGCKIPGYYAGGCAGREVKGSFLEG